MPIELVAKSVIQLISNIIHVFHHCMFNVNFFVFQAFKMFHVLGIFEFDVFS